MASKVLIDIRDRLNAIHAEQARQGVILETHERRSTNLEARVIPIERHVNMWGGVGKALAVLATLVAIAAAILRVVG